MSTLKGLVSILLLVVTTLSWGVPLVALTLVKLVTPGRRLRRIVLKGLNGVALNWVGTNLWWIRRWLNPPLETRLPDELTREQWWLVLSNHRSYTDIFLLFLALHRRIPMPHFFVKRQLIWIPIVGLAFWAMEFPMLRRLTREQRERNPHLARRDQEATERMCRHARERPIAIYNFVEGTRFTPVKQAAQGSPYRHLLKPRAGGIAQVLSLLGDRLGGILDVTLHYTNPRPTFWGFLCGREAPVTLQARRLEVPDWMLDGNYHDDPDYKERFHSWLNALWQEKDDALSRS
ncbi:acyltransferase [Halomonas urumqiensis]|uniref:Acyltransferase n=1 Tax=Halomonas urumqiensis TaxID=1684789 RepID=A0A2N7UPR3_9GAMM|nr:acyltransferase [Halomonas urumqiensis]PMR82401.1 acyltransferase [Halomonas urumqiensis]PTB04119.1 acyltransferase [Halomonas urumqiensis]GHE19613.1 acyltransferase [Halomonas urumqiensis]